jgi:hypothetical protein
MKRSLRSRAPRYAIAPSLTPSASPIYTKLAVESRAGVDVAAADPERVRVLVVTDWDAGFALTTRPPLPDVAPGDMCMIEFAPQRSVTLLEILVEGFVLVQVAVVLDDRVPLETRLIRAAVGTRDGRNLYRLDSPITVGTETGESLRLFLCNTADVPRKQKSVTLVKDSSPHQSTGETFFDKFLRSEVTAEQIDDHVDAWHTSASKLPLHLYLGMTEKEYAAWMSDAESLEASRQARLQRIAEPA